LAKETENTDVREVSFWSGVLMSYRTVQNGAEVNRIVPRFLNYAGYNKLATVLYGFGQKWTCPILIEQKHLGGLLPLLIHWLRTSFICYVIKT
jgi:hypothetical protein